MADGIQRAVGRRAHPALTCERGACAAGDQREADAGARMLAVGGNAVDAAVAAAFVGFVVEQVDCGLGGFARVSVWHPETGFHGFDGYVRAPRAARADLFELAPGASDTYYGHPPTRGDRARHGPLAVAVPGAVAALLGAHEAFGALPRARVLAPAIEIAVAGIRFTWRDALVIAQLGDRVRAQPDAAEVLLPGGRVPRTPVQHPDGDRMDTTALAKTLEAIADGGEDAFYRGPIAAAIAAHVKRRGGILEAEDLAGFRARAEPEPPARYRGHDYATCFDPIGYEALGILGGFDLPALDPGGFDARHLTAEALGAAFTDVTTHHGDPAFVASPVRGLRSPAFADARRATLRRDRALERPIAPADPWPHDPGPRPGEVATEPSRAGWEGTSQMVAADAGGTLVSIITAVGWNFGSLVYVPETGMFLNNGMSYFDPRPGRPASIAPGKQPLFGAPALVMAQEGRPRLAAAGSGGYRIQSAVVHAATGVVDHDLDAEEAAERPRVHCQGGQTYVDARAGEGVIRALAAAGHDVVVVEEDASTWHFGRVCLVSADPRTGAITASASPHWLAGVAGV